MTRKKKTKNTTKTLERLILITTFLFLSAAIILRIKSEITTPTPVIESVKTEQKTIPKDLKQKLNSANSNKSIRVPILMYHYVEYVKDQKDTIRQSLNISPFVFEQQIRELKDSHYTFLTVSEVGEILDNKRLLPQNPIAITFDDGHWDVATEVLPILKKYNVQITLFVIPGFLNKTDFLTEKQLQELIDSRLVEVGSHTVHHVSLKDKSYDLVKKELSDSKEMLESKYHIKVLSFAYPNGSFDKQAADLVKDTKYQVAVSTIPGVDQTLSNKYFLSRLRPGRRTGQEFLDWLKKDSFKPYN